MASFEQLVFEIIAKDAEASAAFDRFRRKVDDTSKSVDKNSASMDKNAQSMDKNKQHATSWMGVLAGVGTALAPISAGAIAAGAGFSAFAALAVPSVMKISTALSSKGGGLGAQWMTLDSRQRNAALGVQALGDKYQGLAHAMEPRTFQIFSTALGFANSLLGPTAKLADSAGKGIESFLVQFSQHAGLQQFITVMSRIAGPALASLGSDITHIAHAVFQLIQSFAGTGLMELRLLSGVFTALDASITFLSQHAPALTNVALTVGGLALALSKLGALGSVLKITGLANIATQMTGFAAATKGATLAEKGMLATTTALDAISPVGWAVLAAAAVGGLVFWLSRFNNVTHDTITAIEAQNKAVGFNTSGYYQAAFALQKYNQANEQGRVTVMNLHTGMVTGTTTIGQMTGATGALTAAQHKLVTEGNNQQAFLTTLENKYHLTRDAAISLAEKSGVLATDVNKGGQSMKDATAKAEAYANANLKAQRPTSQLAQDMSDFANKTLTATARTTALTNALKLFFNPAVTADQDVIALKNDQVALAQALQASSGKTGLLTQKQRDARGAFDTYISQVAQTAQDTFNATGRTSSYTKVIDQALPFLERAAGHNKTLRQEIQALIDTENKIRTEKVQIIVTGKGTWRMISPGQSLPGGFPGGTGAAAGMLVRGGIPGRDSVLVNTMPGELIVPTPMVRAGAVDHLRGKIPGFAAGGVVGSYSDGIGGLPRWVQSENAATIRAMASSVASAVLAAVRAATTFGGGLGRASLRQIENWWIGAGGPGGGTAHVAAAITGAESGFNPRIVQAGQPYATTGWGLWQITPGNSEPQVGIDQQLLNGPTNARAAVAKYRQAGGFTPWTTFVDGAYLKFMDSGGWLQPGTTLVTNNTGRPEQVIPPGGGDLAALLEAVIDRLDTLADIGASAPHRTGRALGDALNGVARSSAYSSMYGSR